MGAKKLFVFAIYSSPSNAEQAINSLISAEFDPAAISIWFAQPLNSRITSSTGGQPAQEGHEPDLIDAGIPAFASRRYEEFIRKGGILLSLRCKISEECERARRIMRGSHADDVSSASESAGIPADPWPTLPPE